MALSRSIHIADNGITSFLFMAGYYSVVYMYHFFFISYPVDGHLDCFHVLAIANGATVNITVLVSSQIMFFSGYMPRNMASLMAQMAKNLPAMQDTQVQTAS